MRVEQAASGSFVGVLFELVAGGCCIASRFRAAQIRVRTDQSIDARDRSDGRIYQGTVAEDVRSQDGRMLVHLALPDSWFNPPAILDLTTGRVTRLANNPLYDYGPTWTPDADTLEHGLRLNARIVRAVARLKTV